MVTTPFIHEHKFPLDVAFKRLEILISLVEKFIPKKTTVVWIPMSKTWKNKTHNEDMDPNTKSMLLNRRLFRLIKNKIINPASNWFGFYNLQSMTSSLKYMAENNVHFGEEYYKVMMGHLLQLLCPELRYCNTFSWSDMCTLPLLGRGQCVLQVTLSASAII